MTACGGRTMALLCLIATGPLHAVAAEDRGGNPASQETTESAPAKERQKSSRSAQKPAKNFNPSEKIRADSAVSFPVDI